MEGIFAISLANSFRFAKVETPGCYDERGNFDNTLVCQEDWTDGAKLGYVQRFRTCDTIKTQIKTEYSTVVAKIYKHDGTEIKTLTVSTDSTYTAYDFLAFSVDMDADVTEDETYYILVTGTDGSLDTVQFRSEPFKASEFLPYHSCIRYTNTDYAFELDYENTTLEHYIRVLSQVKRYQPSGEKDVYNNQGKLTNLRSNIGRMLTMETDPIPRWLAEKITVALAHDTVYVDGKEFQTEGLPEVSDFGKSNLVTMAIELTQVEIVGLNTDDEGFDCEDQCEMQDVIKNFVLEDVSGNDSISIADYYLEFYVDKIIIEIISGTGGGVECGVTVGGDEVMSSVDCSAFVVDTPEPIDIDYTPGAGENSLYFTLTGGSAAVYNIYVVLIRYKTL